MKIHINQEPLSKREFNNTLFYTVVLVLILLFSTLINPAANHLPACLFHSITGHNCPSCGLTRSFYSTARFQIQNGFQFHKMGPVIYLITIMLAGLFMLRLIVRKKIIKFAPGTKIFLISIFIFLYFFIWLVYEFA